MCWETRLKSDHGPDCVEYTDIPARVKGCRASGWEVRPLVYADTSPPTVERDHRAMEKLGEIPGSMLIRLRGGGWAVYRPHRYDGVHGKWHAGTAAEVVDMAHAAILAAQEEKEESQ